MVQWVSEIMAQWVSYMCYITYVVIYVLYHICNYGAVGDYGAVGVLFIQFIHTPQAEAIVKRARNVGGKIFLFKKERTLTAIQNEKR